MTYDPCIPYMWIIPDLSIETWLSHLTKLFLIFWRENMNKLGENFWLGNPNDDDFFTEETQKGLAPKKMSVGEHGENYP